MDPPALLSGTIAPWTTHSGAWWLVYQGRMDRRPQRSEKNNNTRPCDLMTVAATQSRHLEVRHKTKPSENFSELTIPPINRDSVLTVYTPKEVFLNDMVTSGRVQDLPGGPCSPPRAAASLRFTV